MSSKGTIIENDNATKELLIEQLHERDQLFNSSAIRFSCFRNIFLAHFDEYLIKRSRANKRGLTKVIIGLRAVEHVVIYSRETPKAIKEDVRAEIELFMTHMTNTILKMNESSDEPQTLITCEHALVNLVNKFVYHESVRSDILIKALEIKNSYIKNARRIGAYIYKRSGRKIEAIGKLIFTFDKRYIKELTGIDADELKKDIVNQHMSELTELADLLELSSIEDLIGSWGTLNSMIDNYIATNNSRNAFVKSVEPLVTQLCNRALNKRQYSHNRSDIRETLVQSCKSKLLSNIFMYVPNNSYTTFAFPHIQQEIGKELKQNNLVALPAKYRLLQKPVIEAGKHPTKEWCGLRAMEKLKVSHPNVEWTMELIVHCRFGNVIAESIHRDDEDESSFDYPIISNNNPETELRNTQLIEMLMAELNELPEDFRKGLLEYFSDNSDSFSISKSSLVDPNNFSDTSHYRIKKFIIELRKKFDDQMPDDHF